MQLAAVRILRFEVWIRTILSSGRVSIDLQGLGEINDLGLERQTDVGELSVPVGSALSVEIALPSRENK